MHYPVQTTCTRPSNAISCRQAGRAIIGREERATAKKEATWDIMSIGKCNLSLRAIKVGPNVTAALAFGLSYFACWERR